MYTSMIENLKSRPMSSQQLGLFIKDRHMEVIAFFLTEARRAVPAAANTSTGFLMDHLPEVLKTMAAYLLSEGSAQSRAASIEFARKHAMERLGNRKYTADQIRKEYAIVRKAILLLVGTDAIYSSHTVQMFSEICELTLAVVIETFVRHEFEAVTHS